MRFLRSRRAGLVVLIVALFALFAGSTTYMFFAQVGLNREEIQKAKVAAAQAHEANAKLVVLVKNLRAEVKGLRDQLQDAGIQPREYESGRPTSGGPGGQPDEGNQPVKKDNTKDKKKEKQDEPPNPTPSQCTIRLLDACV